MCGGQEAARGHVTASILPERWADSRERRGRFSACLAQEDPEAASVESPAPPVSRAIEARHPGMTCVRQGNYSNCR